MHSLSGFDSAAAFISLDTPEGDPVARSGDVSD